MPRLLVATTIPRTLDDFLLPYARHFRARGWQVHALSGAGFERTKAREVFERTFTVRWSRNPLDPRNLVSTPERIRDLVRRYGYDIVHVHTPVAAFVTRFALRSLPPEQRPQVIYTAHGFHFHPAGSPVRNAVFIALEKLAGHWTDDLVVMNREDGDAARRWRFLPPERIHEMPGIGLHLGEYSSTRVSSADLARLREELGLGDEDRYLLMVAEFIPRKRHADLLRAFALLDGGASRTAAHLVFAGQGPLLEEMRRLAARLGIAERTRFLGQRFDIPTLMRGAAAVVLPSGQEGLPRCILEAMSIGVPIVATRIRGTAQLLENGAGLLVEVGDLEGLTGALREVLARPEAAREAARLGQSRVSGYDIERLIGLHEVLYTEALRRVEAQRSAAPVANVGV
jgi:glycosyltransferase involved in cell wall biosynthesis